MGILLPSLEVDVLLHVGFEDVLVSFLLTTSQSFPLLELGVEMLW